ncbi:hypothetical protein TCAL_09591 [Tigriopus californicus]|uniref:Uncharacterized protein n=1 Tax=Tigriopus californicus TaxID=6832 RepID=A0A553PEX0_TIGCA|nr:P2X purinoceptor 4-like [Tigriopus californicus]TRY76235.1 hypothetical protein TCAL_09591 [Tigriopus californicus]
MTDASAESSRGELKGLAGWCYSFFEYETPKVVTIQNVPLGILRLLLQMLVIGFVVLYQLWYARGYQEFAEVESSVTTKVKGFSRSELTERARGQIPEEWHYMYERVWDEADYVVPPAENGAFFVMTNLVITPNQTRSMCPEDPIEVPDVLCSLANNTCVEGQSVNLVKGHGTMTGNCVPSDRLDDVYVCEIRSWCPVEVDRLPLNPKTEGPLIPGFENYTVFIKNSIAFPRFGDKYERKNMRNPKEKGAICVYHANDPPGKLCPIFRLGDIVEMAGGNITKLAAIGGVIGIDVTWNCDLDWNFMTYCLPKYGFTILDDFGWNFRHAFYHEENRRTLIKAYGLKFLLVIDGRASKFDLKNTVIVIVTGLGLLGLSTMFCDFVLLNYSSERMKVKEKKYETVPTTSRMLESTLKIISQTSALGMNHDKKTPQEQSIALTASAGKSNYCYETTSCPNQCLVASVTHENESKEQV